MKYLILTLLLTFSTIIFVNAESRTPTSEEKKGINPVIDEGFTKWGANWTTDTYISRSARINNISIDEDYGDYEVSGTFSYKRFRVVFDGTFTAKLNNNGFLVSISYIDANGMRGSKTF